MTDIDFKTWLADLKAKSDIVSVISRYCNVVQKGRSYWTCCPFHMEKTPSLCIYEYEQTFHCYGCKEHGDVVRFVMKMESCDFMQAVEILAKNLGIEIPNFSIKDDDGIEKRKKDKDLVLSCLAEANNHYKSNLYKNIAKPAQEYIKKRLLTKKELEDFGLGYSMNFNEIITYLKSKGYNEDIMQKAGLISKGQGGEYYDVFAYRLMFPLFNMYNECIGFSGRILTEDKTKAKYRNSSNTIVFDKSKTIYGLNLLRLLKQKEHVDKIIIVEGQMDVIAMHKAGFKNTVACLGTAFTEQHAKQLKLISDNVVVCLDGDNAGSKAANKIVDILAKENFVVRAVCLPNGNDPDEYIKNCGIDAMKKQIDNAIDYIFFQINYLAKSVDFTKTDEKAKFVKESLSLLEKLETESEKQIYLKQIKDLSGVPMDFLRQDVMNQSFTAPKTMATQEVQNAVGIEDGTNKAIKYIFASLLFKKIVVSKMPKIRELLFNDTYVKLYDFLMKKIDNNEPFTVSSLYDIFNFDDEPNLVDIVNYNFEQIGNNEKYYNECLWKVVEQGIKNEQIKLNEQFKVTQDINLRKEILIKINDLAKKLKNKVMED